MAEPSTSAGGGTGRIRMDRAPRRERTSQSMYDFDLPPIAGRQTVAKGDAGGAADQASSTKKADQASSAKRADQSSSTKRGNVQDRRNQLSLDDKGIRPLVSIRLYNGLEEMASGAYNGQDDHFLEAEGDSVDVGTTIPMIPQTASTAHVHLEEGKRAVEIISSVVCFVLIAVTVVVISGITAI